MPLLWASLAFLAGILLGEWMGGPPLIWLGLAGLCLALLLLRPLFSRFHLQAPFPNLRSLLPLPFSLLLAVAAMGAVRGLSARPQIDPGFIAWYNDRNPQAVIEGVIVEPPDERDTYSNLFLQADRYRPVNSQGFTPVSGLLLVRVAPGGGWRYGDRLLVHGALQAPPVDDTFSYRDYLARRGVYSYMPQAGTSLLKHDQGSPILAQVYRFKDYALAVVYRIFPDPEASLLAGILLGVDARIPAEVQQAFQVTGTAHIIAISGFNITIIAGLFATLFSKVLGRRRGAVAAALAIAAYAVLVGATASVLRAALMGGLSLLARQVGRQQDGLNSLGFVAALLALFNPNILWDVGFQLTFMATLGLVLYAAPLGQAFVRLASRRLPLPAVNSLAGPVGEFFLFTLAAQITTLPITLYHFQRLSLVSLLANPVVLPAQPAVEVLGGLALILGMIYPPLGQLAAYLAWPFVVFTIRALEFFARFPAAMVRVAPISLAAVILFYTLLFGLTMIAALRRAGKFPSMHIHLTLPKIAPGLALAALAVLTALTWRAALSASDGRLHLTLLGSGGQALIVQTPTGRSILIGGGPSPVQLSDALGRRLPLGQRRLDYLLVASAAEQQLSALPQTLERFPTGNVLWAGSTTAARSARDLQLSLAAAHVPVIPAQPGQVLDLGQGAALRVLAVGPSGAVLQLEWKNFHALLPIGLDGAILEELQAGPPPQPVDALLLAGAGSTALNPPGWIASLHPQVVLLSVIPGDRTAQPDPAGLAALEGYPLLRTDRNGWVELTTDGDKLWVEVEKN